MSAKQDRQGVRTAVDLERKYNFGRVFQKIEEGIEAVNRIATRAAADILQLKGYVDAADKEIKAFAKTAFSNPNILDNWYFVDPVNQRGQTKYTAKDFAFDRWVLNYSADKAVDPYVSLGDGCIVLHNGTAQGTSCSCYIYQTVDNPGRLAGKTVTFSVKFKGITAAGNPRLIIRTNSGDLAGGYIRTTHANSIITFTTTLPGNLTELKVLIGAHSSYGGDGNFTLEIESAKLELGAVSTLANDEPPKKSEQLMECQRYYIRFGSDGGQWLMGASNGTTLYAPLHLPVPLRVFPSEENGGKFNYANVNIYPYVSGGKVEITSLTLHGASGTQDFMLYANHASNALAAKQPGCIRFTTGGYIGLSAEI